MMMLSSVRELYLLKERDERWHSAIARLKPGVSFEQAQAEMDAIARRLEQNHPDTNANRGALVTPLHEQLFGGMKLMLWILLGAVGCVLLVACANVSNLLLAQYTARWREFTIRTALGAGRLRMARQLVFENLLLTLPSAALGALLAGAFVATPRVVAAFAELDAQTIAGGSTGGTANGGWSMTATAAQPAVGPGSATGEWTLASGYWPVATRPGDVLFRDGFEP